MMSTPGFVLVMLATLLSVVPGTVKPGSALFVIGLWLVYRG
ncbi:hypothetical protein [Bradyrhizobium sp. 137]|nr:hypothetical protein [Bradyrhizobium sp. 137]